MAKDEVLSFDFNGELNNFALNKFFKFSDTYIVDVSDEDGAGNLSSFYPLKGVGNLPNISIGKDPLFLETTRKSDNPSPNSENIKSYIFHLHNCVSVKIPYPKKDIESFSFANINRNILMPNLNTPAPLEIELAEDETGFSHRFIEYLVSKTTKVFPGVTIGEDNKESYYRYRPHAFINCVKVKILNNDLDYDNPIITHRFDYCKVTSYDFGYSLSYNNTDSIVSKLSLTYLKHRVEWNNSMLTKLAIERM